MTSEVVSMCLCVFGGSMFLESILFLRRFENGCGMRLGLLGLFHTVYLEDAHVCLQV